MPFSRFFNLLIEGGPASKPRENPPLRRFQRDEKSTSPSGNVQIAWRVVGQDTDRDRLERAALLDSPVDSPEAIDMIYEQGARPIFEHDREEERAALRAPISRHLRSPQVKPWARFALPTLRELARTID
jgi:hypothetical protein